MADERTARLALPLIQPGQAQKELDHNEALALLDLATQAVVESVGVDTPPAAPTPGQCWIVGDAPVDAWTGQAKALVGWTNGGWRFVAARDGMTAWSRADGQPIRFDGSRWLIGTLSASALEIGGNKIVGPRQPAIAPPTAGTIIDAEARAAVDAILAALREHGLIAR